MNAFTLTPPDPALLKRLGRAQLQADRTDDALLAFAAVLRQDPQDLEAQLLLGDCYLARGDAATAYYLYLDASNRAGGDPAVDQRLALARAERQRRSAAGAAAAPTDFVGVSRLVQAIAGRAAPIAEADLEQAASMLAAIVSAPSPAAAVAAHLDRLNTLLPALLELNIRQARADGRPDLAEALQNLQDNIRLQLSARALETAPAPENAEPAPAPALGRGPCLHVALPDPAEWLLPSEALQALGFQVEIGRALPAAPARPGDVLLAGDPHLLPEAAERLPGWIAAGGKLIVWLSHDFEQLPDRHPDAPRLGLTTRARQDAYAAALHLADAVVAPSQVHADRLTAAGRPAWVAPPAWDRRNPAWNAAPPARTDLHLGWAGFSGDAEDLAAIRRVILRLLREYPHTRLVVLGDAAAYQLFEAAPAGRCLFVPVVDTDDYAFALGQVDVLLTPLRDTAYNHARSDQALMLAGARRLPWLASPTPAHLAWAAGGWTARSLDDWYAAAQRLILDADLRHALGRAGRQRAEDRELNRIGPVWRDVLDAVTRQPHLSAPRPAAASPETPARLRLKPELASYLFGAPVREGQPA